MTDSAPISTRRNESNWLLYGANGYTGNLIAIEAIRRGLQPVLAGRNPEAIRLLAKTLSCEYRVFDLEDPVKAAEALRDIDVVLHCAGPFIRTAQPMINACLASGTHYMDITGEIPVLEQSFTRHEEARNAGITVLPGSGYDVVPTDCLAMMLKELLPDASRLRLAFCGKIRQSPGTWKATLDALPRCGAVRKDGALMEVPHAWKTQRIGFDHRVCNTISIPWGDVSSAWQSTGIPDIEVYGGVAWLSSRMMRFVRGSVCWLMRKDSVMNAGKRIVSTFVRGPSLEYRVNGKYHLRGDVWNDQGEQRTMFMQTPEGYTCTIESTLAILPHIFEGRIPAGVWTPSQALGSSFANSLPGIRLMEGPKMQTAPV